MNDFRRAMLYPVTTTTLALAAVITLAAWRHGDFEQYVITTAAFGRQPWRILTSILAHGDFMHILFNALWAWQIGPVIEARFGTARTAAIFLGTGIISSLAEYAFLRGGIGLSGIGYGLLGMGVVLTRHDRRLFGFLDRRTISYFVFWFFLCIFLTWRGTMAIANIAHGVGFAIGWLFGQCVVLRGMRRKLVQAGTAALMLLVIGAAWPNGPIRPRLNCFGEGAAGLDREAFAALRRGDRERAVQLFRLGSSYRSADPDLKGLSDLTLENLDSRVTLDTDGEGEDR